MRFFVCLAVLMLILAQGVTASEKKLNFTERNMKHTHNIFIFGSTYEPDDAVTATGNKLDGTLVHGGWGWFNTKHSMISLSYGSFSESDNNQEIEVNPFLVEYTWFFDRNERTSNWDFFIGAGFGTFNIDWQPTAAGTSYSDTDWGMSFRLGTMYHMSEHFSLTLEGKYLLGGVDDLVPATVAGVDRDIEISDWTYGIGLNYHF